MNFYFKIYFFIVISCLGLRLDSAYNNGCHYYTDEFGPLQTGYTMGDLVRYTVSPGKNIYSDVVKSPAGAQDIKNFGNNTYNLYNALGYLYAGWAALNFETNLGFSEWIKYRQINGGSKEYFDNNQKSVHTLYFPSNPGSTDGFNYLMGGYHPFAGDTNRSFNNTIAYYFFQDHGLKHYGYTMTDYADATKSFGWCGNGNGNYMVIFGKGISYPKPHMKQTLTGWDDWSNRNIPGGYVYPVGQFFGARIAHILGAVVNDVPWSTDTISRASGGTGAFTSPLISGTDGKGTALPMIAIMQGGPYSFSGSGITATSTAPAGMFQPSTAHFGSMQTFLLQLSKLPENNVVSNYLVNHLNPAVSRLATLCSYKISTNTNTLNLIEIIPTMPGNGNMTAYDNGVIFAIQNNTGDQLQINQVTSEVSTPIGSLSIGQNNYFLHTASLMSGATPPSQNHMISIIDSSVNNIATYIQVLSAAQLTALYDAVNIKLESITLNGQALPGLSYNQIMSDYTVPTDTTPAYVVVTNFNPTLDSNNNLSSLNLPTDSTSQANIMNSYRIQAINVAEFAGKPYFMTMQINKENVGYGVQTNYATNASGNYIQNANGDYAISGYSLSSGALNDYILYPSIVSAQLYTWQNHAHYLKSSSKVEYYSQIPLLMLPETVLRSGIVGLQAYYLIWLMSYAAAMTECSYNDSAFGDIQAVYQNVFSLLQSKSKRLVIDQQGNLKSGQLLELGDHSLLSNVAICGCDTFDSGGGFNQDIPILNIYTDTQGNPLANKQGEDYINLMVSFGRQNGFHQATSLTDFCNLYGLPYSNVMLFSVPKQALKDGVSVITEQPVGGNYQLIVTSNKDYIDANGNTIQAGSVLATSKIFFDSSLYTIDENSIQLNFLHKANIANPNEVSAWNSPCTINSFSGVGKKNTWDLKYTETAGKNSLSLSLAQGHVSTKNIAKVITVKGPVINLTEKHSYGLASGEPVGETWKHSLLFANNSPFVNHPLILNGKAVNKLGETILNLLNTEKQLFFKLVEGYDSAHPNNAVTILQVINANSEIVATHQFEDPIKTVRTMSDLVDYHLIVQTAEGGTQDILVKFKTATGYSSDVVVKLVQTDMQKSKPKVRELVDKVKAKTSKFLVESKSKIRT